MSDYFEEESNEEGFVIEMEQWWLTIFHRQLVWARLRVFDSGIAQVFDSTGNTLVYESQEIAASALMDAEFRSLDGMDDDDAETFGILLEDLVPPEADNDDELVPLMMRTLPDARLH